LRKPYLFRERPTRPQLSPARLRRRPTSCVTLSKTYKFRVRLTRPQLSRPRLRRRPASCFSLEKTLTIQGEADEAAAESHEAEEKVKKLTFLS
jgi:hypothetical protein